MQAAATLIFENIYLMKMENSNDESYRGSWSKPRNIVLDTNHERTLEEELERIMKLADRISEKAELPGESLSGLASDKRQKGKRCAKRNMLTSLVIGGSRPRLRSTKSSVKQPRLSPLAARAALAASVTPLRQGSEGGVSGKPQGLNLLSGAGKAGASPSKNEKKDNRVKKGQNTMPLVRRGYQAAFTCEKIAEPSVKEASSLLRSQYDQDIQLIVDIPIYKDNYVEKARTLTVDVPFSGKIVKFEETATTLDMTLKQTLNGINLSC